MGGRGGNSGGRGPGRGMGPGRGGRPPGGRGRRLGKEMGGAQHSGQVPRGMPWGPSADTGPITPASPADARRNKSDAIKTSMGFPNAAGERSASLPDMKEGSVRRKNLQRVAVIDLELCRGCGVCASFCPENAFVFINSNPMIRPGKCTGCGLCIDQCPSGAIALMEAKIAAWTGREGRATGLWEK